MLAPGREQGCPSCSFMADHSDGMNVHLAHRDVTFVAVSRAPLSEIERFRRRMGWQFKWVSSHGTDFNRDFGVTFTPEEVAKVQTRLESTHWKRRLPTVAVMSQTAIGEFYLRPVDY